MKRNNTTSRAELIKRIKEGGYTAIDYNTEEKRYNIKRYNKKLREVVDEVIAQRKVFSMIEGFAIDRNAYSRGYNYAYEQGFIVGECKGRNDVKKEIKSSTLLKKFINWCAKCSQM